MFSPRRSQPSCTITTFPPPPICVGCIYRAAARARGAAIGHGHATTVASFVAGDHILGDRPVMLAASHQRRDAWWYNRVQQGAGTGYAGHCIGAYRMRQHGVGHATIMYAESWNRQTWELHRAYRMLPPAMKTAATIHDGGPTHDGGDVVFATSVVVFCDDRR